MNKLNDLELSKALALALGWPEHKLPFSGNDHLWVHVFPHEWKTFDYRDELIAFRVAERFNLFPYKASNGLWFVQDLALFDLWDTPQRAIAEAAIQLLTGETK